MKTKTAHPRFFLGVVVVFRLPSSSPPSSTSGARLFGSQVPCQLDVGQRQQHHLAHQQWLHRGFLGQAGWGRTVGWFLWLSSAWLRLHFFFFWGGDFRTIYFYFFPGTERLRLYKPRNTPPNRQVQGSGGMADHIATTPYAIGGDPQSVLRVFGGVRGDLLWTFFW